MTSLIIALFSAAYAHLQAYRDIRLIRGMTFLRTDVGRFTRASALMPPPDFHWCPRPDLYWYPRSDDVTGVLVRV
jgi:hypothetical protein